MSKLYATSTAGIDIQIPGPETAEEYDALAKKPGQVVEDAVYGEIYRGTLPTIQEKAVEKLKALTSIEPAINDKQTEKNRARAKTPEAAAKVKPVTETFNSYVDRLRANFAGDEAALKSIVDCVKEVALNTPVDPSPTSRSKGPGAAFLEKADTVLALDDEAVEAKVAKWQGLLDSEFPLERGDDGRPTRESLAHLAKAAFQAS